MGAIVPSFLFDFESNMQRITEVEYARLKANLWYPKVAKIRSSMSRKERIAWLMSTAQITTNGQGGNIRFDDMGALSTEYVMRNAAAGLKLNVNQVNDNDGDGFQFASEWSAHMGAYMAYWPQKQVVKAMLNGETGVTYDGIPFFGTHPYNPLNTGLGTFKNMLTGAASGAYPGACPVDDSVTVDVALNNLSKAVAYIASVKMPNGEDPRMLVPRFILNPPRMSPRVQQLLNAKFIAQAGTGGAGSADVQAMIANWGFAPPQEVQEFGGGQSYTMDPEDGGGTVTGDDKTYYIVCEQISASSLGALTYIEREPFKITYYTGGAGDNFLLDRARELEWHLQGRNVTGYGHPFLIYKCKGS